MDPRYTDFGEVEFYALHPTMKSNKEKKSVAFPILVVQQLKAMPVARLGRGNNFALYWLDLVTLRTIIFWWKFRLSFLDPILT